MSSGARSSGSSAARSSQRISAISAEGRALQVPGCGEDGGLDLRGGLVRGVGEPDAQQLQFSRGQHDPHFLLKLPGCRLGGGLAGLGLAAGMHELVRATLADGQEPAGVVEDADGGDDYQRFTARPIAAAVLSAGARIPAAGPWRARDVPGVAEPSGPLQR